MTMESVKKSKGKSESILRQMKMKTQYTKTRHEAKAVLRRTVIAIIAYIKKILNKQHKFTFQRIRKRRTN